MSERHTISVIIPAYNRAGLIGETLRSLVNQTVTAKETHRQS
ncbi:MAG: glycosyltransferase [Spartobacteria bacterium]